MRIGLYEQSRGLSPAIHFEQGAPRRIALVLQEGIGSTALRATFSGRSKFAVGLSK